MKKIKAGVIGLGYIGESHIEAIRRLGFAECVAVADINVQFIKEKCEALCIPKFYSEIDDLLADPEIEVVHNCTPNNLHKGINIKIIKAGKHIFSEKPLAINSHETKEMLEILKDHPDIINGINYCYRMNPLVQDTKHRIRKGEIGNPLLVHGSYLQDWLMQETDYNWRIEPEISGLSRCISDIGTHWMDIVQCILDAKIVEVCADLVTVYPIRKKPTGEIETFSANVSTDYTEKQIKTEDYGAVLFKMDNGVSGVFYVSQVSAGHGCYLNFEVDGTKCSVAWNQETGDTLWIGYRDEENRTVIRNPNRVNKEVLPYTHLAKGHPEGWNDMEKATIYSFYDFIRKERKPGVDQCDFATFEDGHYLVKLVEAILESNKNRAWVKL